MLGRALKPGRGELNMQSLSLSSEQLVKDLSPSLLSYLRRYVGDSVLADDLLQETLIRITRGLPGFEGRSSVKTWAFSIATRVAADHFRKPAHRVRIVDVDETLELVNREVGIEQRMVIDEMNACVRKVIDSLPEDYRAALVLHDLEGLTSGQVAEISNCSIPTAKIRIYRARLRLRKALEGECTFYRDSENVLRCDQKQRASEDN
jgi:RNA polymerase sigma-70 factor, ECF subfamily